MLSFAILRMGIGHSDLMFNTLSSDMIAKYPLNKLLGTIGVQLYDKVAGLMFSMDCDGKVSLEGITLPVEKDGMAEIRMIINDDKEHGGTLGELDRKWTTSVDMDELTNLECTMAKVVIRLLRVLANDARNTM